MPEGRVYSEQDLNKGNLMYWLKVNECDICPKISVKGEYNFLFYHGNKADVVFLDIKNRDHGQTFDDAALVWDYLFSGIQRNEEGNIVCLDNSDKRKGDSFAVAIAKGCQRAYFCNRCIDMPGRAAECRTLKYHGLNGKVKVRGEYLCVPLSFLGKIFNAELFISKEGRCIEMYLPDGRNLQFAEGSIGYVNNGQVRCMYCEALYRKNGSVEIFLIYTYQSVKGLCM